MAHGIQRVAGMRAIGKGADTLSLHAPNDSPKTRASGSLYADPSYRIF